MNRATIVGSPADDSGKFTIECISLVNELIDKSRLVARTRMDEKMQWPIIVRCQPHRENGYLRPGLRAFPCLLAVDWPIGPIVPKSNRLQSRTIAQVAFRIHSPTLHNAANLIEWLGRRCLLVTATSPDMRLAERRYVRRAIRAAATCVTSRPARPKVDDFHIPYPGQLFGP